jgi:hypothetical protein
LSTHDAVDGKEAVVAQTARPPIFVTAGSGPLQELGGEGVVGLSFPPQPERTSNAIATSVRTAILYTLGE